jgi:D-3-phosphoglycerate dehydrogenase
MTTRRVLVTDYAWPSVDIERAILADVAAELVVAENGEPDELVRLAGGVSAILTNWRRLPAEALDAAPDCLVVARYGVGIDNIPVEHATELGILVVNVPDFCVDEVSDHTMALLLACARRVVQFSRSTSRGSWELEIGRQMPRLSEQTLGLVGFGNIARRVVPKARGFGLRVLAYKRSGGPASAGVELVDDIDRLLAESDYVSLHVPTTPATRGLIGERALGLMKETAFIINTSRGPVIDENALERALREGRIAGAALDVLSREPPPADHPLLGLENCIVTPHAAFYSLSSIPELQRKTATNVATVLRGRVPETVVNPEVTTTASYRLARRAAEESS